MKINEKKDLAKNWFEFLRDEICQSFQNLENTYTESTLGMDVAKAGKFQRKSWQRPSQNKGDAGGGVMSLMHGNLFEKVGVNVSTVYGEFSEEFRKEIPGAEEDPSFWASGISLVTHPKSPLIPPVHMNTRFIVTQKHWFGGGADLNPIYPNAEETEFFHENFRDCCENYSKGSYKRFKETCDKYFYISHRDEPRGVGGIFFDYLNDDWLKDFEFVKNVGKTFLATYSDIVKRKMELPWSEEQRQYQLHRRGRYVEFNLIYDRGTRFGLKTGGNPEAILMSLPPVVTWNEYEKA